MPVRVEVRQIPESLHETRTVMRVDELYPHSARKQPSPVRRKVPVLIVGAPHLQ